MLSTADLQQLHQLTGDRCQRGNQLDLVIFVIQEEDAACAVPVVLQGIQNIAHQLRQLLAHLPCCNGTLNLACGVPALQSGSSHVLDKLAMLSQCT